MTIRTALVIATAALAAAPAAQASPRDIPVDAGEVEHRVRTYKTEASYTVAGAVPRHVKTEEWISRDRYHSRTTDVQSGALVAETFQTGSRIAIWTPSQGNHVSTAPRTKAGRPIVIGHSFAEEAAIQREVILTKRWYDQVGERTYVSNASAPSDTDNTTTVVLNPDFTIVTRTNETRLENGGWFRQTEETLVQETLEGAPSGAFAAKKARVAAKKRKRARRG